MVATKLNASKKRYGKRKRKAVAVRDEEQGAVEVELPATWGKGGVLILAAAAGFSLASLLLLRPWRAEVLREQDEATGEGQLRSQEGAERHEMRFVSPFHDSNWLSVVRNSSPLGRSDLATTGTGT